MTFVERYGPWALVTGASATVDELSLSQPFKNIIFRKYLSNVSSITRVLFVVESDLFQ